LTPDNDKKFGSSSSSSLKEASSTINFPREGWSKEITDVAAVDGPEKRLSWDVPSENEEEREEVGLDIEEEPEFEEKLGARAGARNLASAPERCFVACANPVVFGGGGGRGGNVDGVTVRK